MNKLLKELYDCFYTSPDFSAQKQQVEEYHQSSSVFQEDLSPTTSNFLSDHPYSDGTSNGAYIIHL